MKSVIIASDYVQDIQASSSPALAQRDVRDDDVLAKVPVRDDEMLSLFRALQMLLPEKQHWTLGIVSTLPGEGASTIARGLARTVARTPNAKVLICDVGASDRRSRFERRERDTRSSTRASIGDGEGRIDFTWLPGSQVAVGTFGDSAGLNALAADMDRVRSMVSSVSAGFELVILDLPPVNASVIGPALAKAVDGVVLVVEAERTRAQSVRATHKTLEMYGANVLGVVAGTSAAFTSPASSTGTSSRRSQGSRYGPWTWFSPTHRPVHRIGCASCFSVSSTRRLFGTA